MKHNLGSFLLFCSFVLLQAEDFRYHFHIDKPNPYVKEAVILTLDINQTNPNVVLLFNFDLVKSDNYDYQRLDSIETDEHPTQGLHKAQLHYTYLIYPLRAGNLGLEFELIKKVTTDDSVAYSFSGDRDNVKGLVTTDTLITLPPLFLKVKALPQGTQIVGDFSLDYTIKKRQLNAFEPSPFKVTLKGLGYPPIVNLLAKDVNFTVFTEKPLLSSKATTQGTNNTVHYSMAFSSSKDFSLPSIVLKAFNPKNQHAYTLTVPAQDFDVKKVSVNHLIDKVNSPKVLETDWSWLENLFTYLLVFIAGYFTSLLLKWRKKKHIIEVNPLKYKIQNTKDAKALLQLLLANNNYRLESCIIQLENSLYENAKISLSKVKKEAIDLI